MIDLVVNVSDAAEAALRAEYQIIASSPPPAPDPPSFEEYVIAIIGDRVFAPAIARFKNKQQSARIERLLRADASVLAAVDAELAKVKDFDPVPVPADIVPGPSPGVIAEP